MAAEISEINLQIRELSQKDRSIPYGAQPGEMASLVKLHAIVSAIPPRSPVDQAAWLLPAVILVQPFPDANHRTAVLKLWQDDVMENYRRFVSRELS